MYRHGNIATVTMVTVDGAVKQQQMTASQLCEGTFDALMHGVRTKDIRYLLAVQKNLINIQNSDGDT